jgi:hypothetical protein
MAIPPPIALGQSGGCAAPCRRPSFARVLAAVAIAAWLALLVFWHAYRKGNRNAKAWAVFTFLAPVAALPLYVVRRWIGKVRQRR